MSAVKMTADWMRELLTTNSRLILVETGEPCVSTLTHWVQTHAHSYGLKCTVEVWSAFEDLIVQRPRLDASDLLILTATTLKRTTAVVQKMFADVERSKQTVIALNHAVEDFSTLKNNYEILDDVLTVAPEMEEHFAIMFARFANKLRLLDEAMTYKHLSESDQLTGLANMRGFYKKFSNVLSYSKERLRPFGVVMVDIDFFKVINDTNDHLIGSYILGRLGRIISEHIDYSMGEFAARFGGDEFVIVLFCDDLEALHERCEKLRLSVKGTTFVRESAKINMTVSLGACFVAGKFTGSEEKPIKMADHELYHSKNNGRDQTSVIEIDATVESRTMRSYRKAD